VSQNASASRFPKLSFVILSSRYRAHAYLFISQNSRNLGLSAMLPGILRYFLRWFSREFSFF